MAALEAALAKAKRRFGAGGRAGGRAPRATFSAREQLSANGLQDRDRHRLLGAFNGSRAAFDQLRETRGSILFIRRARPFMPYAFQLHVAAAKPAST